MRLIDADELMANITKLSCRNCDRRKNSHGRIVYEIGDAPCRACGTYDAIEWICAAGEVDAVPVVRCKDCKHISRDDFPDGNEPTYACLLLDMGVNADWYCPDGERKDDELQTD